MLSRGVVLLALVVLLFSCTDKSDATAGGRNPASNALVAGERGAAKPVSGKPEAKPGRQVDPAYAYRILKHSTPQEMQAESVVVVQMRVKNASSRTWVAKGPVRMGYYWLDSEGKRIPKAQGRALVQKDTAPDGTVGIRCRVKAPAVKGALALVWDMIEDKTWFGSKGAARTRVPVRVK